MVQKYPTLYYLLEIFKQFVFNSLQPKDFTNTINIMNLNNVLRKNIPISLFNKLMFESNLRQNILPPLREVAINLKTSNLKTNHLQSVYNCQ